MFHLLLEPSPDPILALGGLFRGDPRTDKLDLGIGVYRDEAGETPIMRSVRAAEERLVAVRTTKSYVGARGDALFTAAMRDLVFGQTAPTGRIGGLQTPGGTGALRVLAGLLGRARPVGVIWVPDPTWLNHGTIFADVGLRTRTYPYYDRQGTVVRFDAMLASLQSATAGDVVLLHGCCHNPTGADLSLDEWTSLADILAARNVMPLVDFAYQGFGRGLDQDAMGLRHLASQLPEMLVATSCSKNFGIYSERVGCAFVLGQNARKAEVAIAHMTLCARALYSMPPDHGSAIVRAILEDSALFVDWLNELESMRSSMVGKRTLLANALREATGSEEFDYLARQSGMFSLLNLTQAEIEAARQRHGVYLVHDGRINIAGLPIARIPDFAAVVVAVRGEKQSI